MKKLTEKIKLHFQDFRDSFSSSSDVATASIDSYIDELDFNKNFPSFSMIRLLILSLILCTTIFLRQEVLGFDAVIKIYAVLAISFFVSTMSIVYWKDVRRIRFFVPYQMLYDILLTSYLIFLTGINESVFLFLYLINIILAAITYQLLGALIVAILSGTFYAAIYYVNKDTSTGEQFYTLFYNELFFLLTALLSGQLLDEMRKQTSLIQNQRREVSRLRLLTNRLINHLPVGILQIDKDDNVVAINNTCAELLKLGKVPTDEVKYYELVEELQGARAKWFQLTDKERLTNKFEVGLPNGDRKIFALQIVYLPESEGFESSSEAEVDMRTELIFVIQDVSKVTQMEEQLNLESKLAAVGQLAAGIAHEIRTPLASISGSIETLFKNMEAKNEDDQVLVDISLREIYRLDTLITEFLDFVKPTKDRIEDICIEEVIEEVVTAAKNIKHDSLEVQYKLNLSGESYISGDSERLKQVLLNLINNAIEAADQDELLITISTRQVENDVKIIVEDNGSGIPENIRRKIFDPFFTTKKKGTGLGLATVGQIIKTHSGSIQALPKSTGACFEILFPKSDMQSQQIS